MLYENEKNEYELKSLKIIFKAAALKDKIRAREITKWTKALASTPSVPDSWEGCGRRERMGSCRLPSDLCLHAVERRCLCTYTNTHANKDGVIKMNKSKINL